MYQIELSNNKIESYLATLNILKELGDIIWTDTLVAGDKEKTIRIETDLAKDLSVAIDQACEYLRKAVKEWDGQGRTDGFGFKYGTVTFRHSLNWQVEGDGSVYIDGTKVGTAKNSDELDNIIQGMALILTPAQILKGNES